MSAAVPHDEEGTSGQGDLRPSGYHRKSAAAVEMEMEMRWIALNLSVMAKSGRG